MKFSSRPLTISLLGMTAALMFGNPANAAVDLGDASVLSQQGQKLKIAVPYGSTPGERTPVTRFMVQSVKVPDGYPPVRPESLTLFKPERRNVVFLQSREPISAPEVKVVLAVRDGSTTPVAYNLNVPPGRAALSGPGADVDSPAKSRKPVKASARKGRVAAGPTADGQPTASAAAADPADILAARSVARRND